MNTQNKDQKSLSNRKEALLKKIRSGKVNPLKVLMWTKLHKERLLKSKEK